MAKFKLLFGFGFRVIFVPFMFLSFGAFSQNTGIQYLSTAQPVGDFTVCGDVLENTLEVSNGNSGTMENISLTLNFPPGAKYELGSVSGGVELNTTDLQNPVFSLPNIPASNKATFIYSLSMGCEVVDFQDNGGKTQELVDLEYELSGAPQTQVDVDPGSTYNVLAAALSIIDLTPSNKTLNVGESYGQSITIINGGLGCTSTAFVVLDNANGSSALSNPSIGTLSNDTLYLAASEMPGGDGLWCNSEELTITYDIDLIDCDILTRDVQVGWGCGDNACQLSAVQNSNITVANNLPILSTKIVNSNFDFCWDGKTIKQEILIANTGSGPATNIELLFRNNIPGSFTGKNFYDTTVVWEVRNSTGVVLGEVDGFKDVKRVTDDVIKGADCLISTGIYYGTGSLPADLILGPGDTLYIDMYQSSWNLECTPNECFGGGGWAGIQTSLTYKNQCGEGSFVEQFKTLLSRAHLQYRATLNNPTDVVGGEEFNLDLFYSSLRTINNPDGTGTSYIAMPLAGTDFVPAVSSIVFEGETLPVVVQNDTMLVGPLTQNKTYSSGLMRIPMLTTCGTGGVKPINVFGLNSYSDCSPVVKVGCLSSQLTLHCPDPCPRGGATPKKFTLKRVNFGLPDNDDDNEPDATGSIDLDLVNDHNSVNGDTLEGTWYIKVSPNVEPTDSMNGTPFNHTYIDIDLGGENGGPASLNALPNAEIEVFPTGGGASSTCQVSPSIHGEIAHYDLTSCKTTWEGGDSLVVKARYTVNQINADRYNRYNTGQGYNKYVTVNEVYSTYVPQATPTTAPIDETTYTCDHYNDYNEMSRIWLSPYIKAGQVLEGCEGTIASNIRQYTRFQEGANVFPYEYRNFFIPDTMAVQIPSGFNYRSGSGKFESLPILDPDVVQVGDTLYFINLKNYYTPYGGTLIPGDEHMADQIVFNVNPTCDAVPGQFTSSTNTSGIGNGLNTPITDYHALDISPVSPRARVQSNGYIYESPQQVLAGGGSSSSNNGRVTWEVSAQNLSNNVVAGNSYFYIDELNSLSNVTITEQATNTLISPDANGFYLLGDLAASADDVYVIEADLGQCSTDSLRINLGWSCGEYPTVFESVDCVNKTWLKAKGFPAGLDATFNATFTGPGNTVTLCEPFKVTTLINSTLTGNLATEELRIILPPFVTYVPSSTEFVFPKTPSTFQSTAYNPTISGDTLIFDINAIIGTGLTGVSSLDSARMSVRFDAQTLCGFTSGSVLTARVSGMSICGDPTATVVKTTSPIKVDGANATTQYALELVSSDSLTTCGSPNSLMRLTVKNTGTVNSSVKDSLTVVLPIGLNYSTGSVNFIQNPPANTIPEIAGNSLKWRMPDNIAPNEDMVLEFDVNANPDECGEHNIAAAVTQNIVLDCQGSDCNTPVIVGQVTSDTITTVCRTVDIALNVGACEGSTKVFSLTGVVSLENPPVIGTMTIAVGTEGVQVFSAPFDSTVDFSINGLPAQSGNKTATVTFSDDAVCETTADFTSPIDCCTTPNCLSVQVIKK